MLASFPPSLLLAALSHPMNNAFVKFALCASLDKSAAQCGLLHDRLVRFIIEVSGKTRFAGTDSITYARATGETPPCRRLHIHDLACSQESAQGVIGAPQVQ